MLRRHSLLSFLFLDKNDTREVLLILDTGALEKMNIRFEFQLETVLCPKLRYRDPL